MNIKFSVLIPVYNVQKYIEECMNSIVNQTYTNYEVVVVDDGSTDDSGVICDKYISDKIKVIHKKNEGLLMARRTAIEIASGDYCVFVDSDDYVSLELLESLNDKIKKYQADIVVYNAYKVSEKDIIKEVPRFSEEGLIIDKNKKEMFLKELLLEEQLNNIWIKAIKTDLLKNDPTNFDVIKTSMGEDIIQSLYPCFNANRIYYSNEYLYYYRDNASSMTRKYDDTHLENELLKFNSSIYFLKKQYIDYFEQKDNVSKGITTRTLRTFLSFFYNTLLSCSSSKTRHIWINTNWKEFLPLELVSSFYSKKNDLTLLEQYQIRGILSQNNFCVYLYLYLRIIKQRIRSLI